MPHTDGMRTAVVAALSFALLLIAVGYQAGKKAAPAPILAGVYDLQQVQSPGVFPRNIETNNDWEAELTRLFPGRSTTTESITFSSIDVDTPSDRFARALINEYMLLQQGEFTLEAADSVGEELAADLYGIVVYEPYAKEGIQTTSDTSYESMIRYQAEMQDALEPLLTIPEPEFAMFGRIIESGDRQATQGLLDSAETHRAVAEAMAHIVVPSDALQIHLDMMNALAYFGATLKEMVRNTYDPFATLSFLKTYNDAERYVVYAFDTLSAYYAKKGPGPVEQAATSTDNAVSL